jgi:hypothetical protein
MRASTEELVALRGKVAPRNDRELASNPCSGDVKWKNTNYGDAVTNSEADSCAWYDARVWEVIRLENVRRSVQILPLFLRRTVVIWWNLACLFRTGMLP